MVEMAIFFEHDLLGFQVIEHKSGEVSIEETLWTKGRIQLGNYLLRNLSAYVAIGAARNEKGKDYFFQKLTCF